MAAISPTTAIVQHLRSAGEPCNARDVAIALEADRADVQARLRSLVDAGHARRHHNPNGILTYSLTTATPAPAPAEAAGERAPVMAAKARWNGRPTLADRIADVLATTTLLCRSEIMERTGLNANQVQTAIQVLRKARRIRKQGSFTDARWELVKAGDARAADTSAPSDTPMPALAPAPDTPATAGYPGAAGQLIRSGMPTDPAAGASAAVDHAIVSAEAALESYIESVVDRSTYTWLLQAVLDAHRAKAALAEVTA